MKEFESNLTTEGLTAILEHVHALVAIVKKDGMLISWNRAFENYQPTISDKNKIEDFFLNKDEISAKLLLEKHERWVADLWVDMDNPAVPCDCMLIPLTDEHMLFVADHLHTDFAEVDHVRQLSRQMEAFKTESEIARKLAKRKQVEVDGVMAQAHELSNIDALTLLPNRRMLTHEIQNEVLRAERYHTPFTVSLIDVDHFKRINDTHGHLAGDDVLKHIGQLLTNDIRHPDLAGRYGGEEFLILLPNSNARAAAEQAARLCKHVRESVIQIPNHVVQITISIGIAEFKQDSDNLETLLNRADAAMYEAKATGRDRWVLAQ